MDEIEKLFLDLAESYADFPEKFLSKLTEILDQLGMITQVQKIDLLLQLGALLLPRSYINLALHVWDYALKKSIENNYKVGELSCYTNFGNAFHSSGDYPKAIEFQNKALEIAKEIGDKVGKSNCYVNLGTAYFRLSDYPKAIEFHNKALDIAKEIDHKEVESKCYGNLGIAYFRLGDYPKAIEFQNKALDIAKEIGDKVGELRCYANLGPAYFHLDDYPKAIEFHNKALDIAKEIGDKVGESTCYGNLGYDYQILGDHSKAIEFHNKALEIAKEIGDIAVEAQINVNLAFSHYTRLEPNVAYNYLKRAIELEDAILTKLVDEEDKISLLGIQSNVYQFMVPMCLTLKKEEEAFEYVERGKSRAFLDLISTKEIRPTVENISDEFQSLLNHEENILAKLRQTQTGHLKKSDAKVEPGFVDNILQERNTLYNEMERFDPQYVFVRRGKPLSLKNLQEILSQKGNTVLVEYFVTKEKIYIFVVSANKLDVITSEISKEKIFQYIESYQKEVVRYDPDNGNVGNTWEELGEHLIEPISKFLSNADLIYFVPHDLLHYLPLHALKLKGEPILKNYATVYLPSSSVLQFLKNKSSNDSFNSCSIFGVDFLDEAKIIGDVFNTKPFLEANKQTVIENMDADILHFSCHGFFDEIDPLSSGIILKDETLTAREIFDLKINANLVTLSACQTGISKTKPGDELIGIRRALMYAGASSILVSLWEVDAIATEEMMLEFYIQLKKEHNVATALQKAQKMIMGKEDYSHPYFWAAFVLVGSP